MRPLAFRSIHLINRYLSLHGSMCSATASLIPAQLKQFPPVTRPLVPDPVNSVTGRSLASFGDNIQCLLCCCCFCSTLLRAAFREGGASEFVFYSRSVNVSYIRTRADGLEGNQRTPARSGSSGRTLPQPPACSLLGDAEDYSFPSSLRLIFQYA